MLPREKEWSLTLSLQDLDPAGLPRLKDEARRAFQAGVTRLVLDLRDVRHIDAPAVAQLIQLARQAPPTGRVALAGLNSGARLIAGVTRLDELVEIDEGVESVEETLLRATS